MPRGQYPRKPRAKKQSEEESTSFDPVEPTVPTLTAQTVPPPRTFPAPLQAKTFEVPMPKALQEIKPKDKVSYAFDMEHEGKALWAVFMYTIEDGKVIDKAKISSGNMAKHAVKHLANALMQLHLNQRSPEKIKQHEIMPSVLGQM